MYFLSVVSSAVLAIYIIWESARSPAMYRKLKQAIDSGDTTARAKFYGKVYWFEGISSLLALLAFGFDWNRLNPSRLGLDATSFGTWWHSPFAQSDNSFVTGLGIGVLIAVAGALIAMALMRRRSAKTQPPRPRKSKFIPDFSYLLPTTGRERLLFALVALSAGVCEEIVFRAWLLNLLHDWTRLTGWTLAIVAALIFGVAHYYQGVAGVLVTSMLGLFFCGVYVGSGTLLLPIAIHTLVDLRWAIFPSMPGIAPQHPAGGTANCVIISA